MAEVVLKSLDELKSMLTGSRVLDVSSGAAAINLLIEDIGGRRFELSISAVSVPINVNGVSITSGTQLMLKAREA